MNGLRRFLLQLSMAIVFGVVCLPLAPAVFAGTTHGTTDPTAELYASIGDTATPFLVSPACLPSVPGGGGSLTFGAFSCQLYAKDSSLAIPRMFYITQPSIGLGPLNSGDGTYWFGMHRDVSSAVSGWTRQTGTHYLWQKTASQPANPTGGLVAAQITVSGGKITAIVPAVGSNSSRSPSMGIMYAADYGVKCDGTTETSGTLQQAITLAAANSVALQLPGGSCIIRTGMTVPSFSRIIGAPNGELYWDTPIAGTNVVLDMTDAQQIILESIAIRSTNTSATVNATYNNNYPIRLNHTKAVTIRNCHIQDFWGEAGILVAPGATAANTSDNSIITDNILLRGSNYGIEISSGLNNRVAGNYLEDADLGLMTTPVTGTRSQNIFNSNIMYGVLRTNLILNVGGLTTDKYNSYVGNVLTSVRVQASNNFYFGTLSNNTIKAATSSSAGDPPIGIVNANGSTVSGNYIDATNWTAAYSAGYGAITMIGAGKSAVSGNYVSSAPNANGIGVQTAAVLGIKGNTITGNGASGIEVYNTNGDVMIDGNVIYDNNLLNNASYFGISLNGTGATVSSRAFIQNNKIFSVTAIANDIPIQLKTDKETFVVNNVLYPRTNTNPWTSTGSTSGPHYSNNKLNAPSAGGTFTLAASASNTITNANVTTASAIILTPVNSSAAALMGSAKSLYVLSISAFVSFVVRTGDATNPAGTEQFYYYIVGN